jgi:hypothetical protein
MGWKKKADSGEHIMRETSACKGPAGYQQCIVWMHSSLNRFLKKNPDADRKAANIFKGQLVRYSTELHSLFSNRSQPMPFAYGEYSVQ